MSDQAHHLSEYSIINGKLINKKIDLYSLKLQSSQQSSSKMSTPVPELPSYFEKFTSFEISIPKSLEEIFKKMEETANNLEGFTCESKANRWFVTLFERSDSEERVKIAMNLFVKPDGKYLLEIQRLRGDSIKFITAFKTIKSKMLNLPLEPTWWQAPDDDLEF